METMGRGFFHGMTPDQLNGFENWKKENKLLKEIVIKRN
jgi:hypothetical protein